MIEDDAAPAGGGRRSPSSPPWPPRPGSAAGLPAAWPMRARRCHMSTPVGPYTPAVRAGTVAGLLGPDRHPARRRRARARRRRLRRPGAPGPRERRRPARRPRTSAGPRGEDDRLPHRHGRLRRLQPALRRGPRRPPPGALGRRRGALPLGALGRDRGLGLRRRRAERRRATAPVRAPRCRGRSGSRRERTVSIRWACSSPSLARRRRTWTSTVRAPP